MPGIKTDYRIGQNRPPPPVAGGGITVPPATGTGGFNLGSNQTIGQQAAGIGNLGQQAAGTGAQQVATGGFGGTQTGVTPSTQQANKTPVFDPQTGDFLGYAEDGVTATAGGSSVGNINTGTQQGAQQGAGGDPTIPRPTPGEANPHEAYARFMNWWIANGGASSNIPNQEAWSTGNFTLPNGTVYQGWNASTPYRPENIDDVRQMFKDAGIELPYSENQGSTSVGDQTMDLQNFLGGPLFTNMGGSAVGNMALNLQLGQALQQGGRSEQSEAILHNLMSSGWNSGANQLSNQLMGDYQRFASSDSLDALKSAEENQARAGVAGAQNSSLNALRDLGITGQGASATGAVNQMHNLGNRALQDQLLAIGQGHEQRQLNRFGMGSQMAQGGANVYNQMVQNPRMQYAARLEQAQNPGLSALIESLYQTGNLGAGQAFARGDQGPSTGALVGAGAATGAAAGAPAGPWGALLGAIGGAGTAYATR